MPGWQAKKFQLPNHNFETTAIKFEDGRAGLCYHGGTLWDDDGGGWEEFIAADWNTVWKEGRPCGFKGLPPDMRIMCPACGAKIRANDQECPKCGVIFEKIKTGAEPPRAPVASQAARATPTPRSKMLDIGLLGVGLLIAGFFAYSLFKPEPPSRLPLAPVEETASSLPPETPARQAQTNYEMPPPYQPPETAVDGQDASSSSVPEVAAEFDDFDAETYYRHIDLDEPQTAHRLLQEASQRLNEEAALIQKEMISAKTPLEVARTREKKKRYEEKVLALSRLIKEYNARAESAQ